MDYFDNLKTITAICFLLLAGCNKQPESAKTSAKSASTTTQVSEDQLKLDTINKMYAELYELLEQNEFASGNEVLYRYSTESFKTILDMVNQFEGEVCGINHDILIQGQDPLYKPDFNFKLNAEKQVTSDMRDGEKLTFDLVCDDGQCQIYDVIETNDSVAQYIKKDCDKLAEYYQESPIEAIPDYTEYPEYKMSYRIDRDAIETPSSYITTYELVISSESDQPVTIDTTRVNRGNCPLYSVPHQNSTLKFGQTYRVGIRCKPEDIKEVNLTMSDGQELTMTPSF